MIGKMTHSDRPAWQSHDVADRNYQRVSSLDMS